MSDLVGAIDQGTTGTRFIVFDGDGTEVASAYEEHRQIYPRPGWVEHDPDEIVERTWSVVERGMAGAGITAGDLRGVGITNLVARATARASELSPAELREGKDRLGLFVEQWSPRLVAVAGVTAFRTAFGRSGAKLGPQAKSLAGAEVWVVPNPSGLNAHETVDTLAGWYRAAAQAAGVALSLPTRFRA